MLRALTFDYWDTLYAGGVLPERVAMRRTAVGALLGAYGRSLPEAQLRALYDESGREAERWWSEEHRGYSTGDRLRWILERAAVTPREGCEHLATAADAVDNALLIDESAFAKKGEKSAGVGRQHNGRLGKVENSQVGVFSVLSRGNRAALTGGRLYLPEDWCNDDERCKKAAIPEDKRQFQSKTQLGVGDA